MKSGLGFCRHIVHSTRESVTKLTIPSELPNKHFHMDRGLPVLGRVLDSGAGVPGAGGGGGELQSGCVCMYVCVRLVILWISARALYVFAVCIHCMCDQCVFFVCSIWVLYVCYMCAMCVHNVLPVNSLWMLCVLSVCYLSLSSMWFQCVSSVCSLLTPPMVPRCSLCVCVYVCVPPWVPFLLSPCSPNALSCSFPCAPIAWSDSLCVLVLYIKKILELPYISVRVKHWIDIWFQT